MAFLLGCEKVRVEFPTRTVFRSMSLGVNEGERIGIVGRNGDGKSTLLKILAGELSPDEGRVIRNGSLRVGLLSQNDTLCDTDTVKMALLGAIPDYQWAKDAKIRSILSGLVSDIDWDVKVATLSGGQRRRLDLARLLIGDWDVLALDEPTNHLDIRAIWWLAGHLKSRWRAGAGALLVVTHDRWFLDEVCLSMWEVYDGQTNAFEGGYSAYIQQRVERDRLASLAEEKRQNTLRRELAWLARGAKARSTKPKFRVEAARALVADVPPLRNSLELKRMAMARLGKQVVELKAVSLRFDSKIILDKVDWLVGPGERIGIVGANGVGKTTLLRLIQGLITPDEGAVKIGKTVRFAVLSQHLEELDAYRKDRVRELIGRYGRRTMLDGKETTPAQLLERLEFSRSDLNEPIEDLSGGQKRRLALMLILLSEPNVLILDEPGNDLDTDMLAAMEGLLDSWPGTLLLVTHDRYLMERVSDQQYALIEGKLRHLPRGVEEYLELTEEAQVKKGGLQEKTVGVSSGRAFSKTPSGKADSGKVSSENVSLESASSRQVGQRLSGGEIRRLRKTLASNERKLETLRTKKEELCIQMQEEDPSDFVALASIQAQLDELQAQIDLFEQEWLLAAEALGE